MHIIAFTVILFGSIVLPSSSLSDPTDHLLSRHPESENKVRFYSIMNVYKWSPNGDFIMVATEGGSIDVSYRYAMLRARACVCVRVCIFVPPSPGAGLYLSV